MGSFNGNLTSLVLDYILEKIILDRCTRRVDKVTSTIDKLVNVDISSILKGLICVLSLAKSVALGFDELVKDLR